jgi:hypothetical protein
LAHTPGKQLEEIQMTQSKIKRLIGAIALVASSAIFAIAEPASVANGQTVTSAGNTQSFVGTVSCSAQVTHRFVCGKAQTLQSCTLACVQQGSPFVLVVQDTSYLLEGNAHEIERFAGGKAMVTGLASHDSIRVEPTLVQINSSRLRDVE